MILALLVYAPGRVVYAKKNQAPLLTRCLT